MSTEKIRQIGLQYGYAVAAIALIEEAALLEVSPQKHQLAVKICDDLALKLRKRADELQTKAIEAMQEMQGGDNATKH